MKLTLTGLVLALLLGESVTQADDDFSKETVKSTQLTESLFMLEGAGGNIAALIGQSGTFLVDDDFAQMADKLVTKLKELKGGSPQFIVNTHFHYDHTGGNEVFGKTAVIISATAVRDRLMHEQTLWKKQFPPVPTEALPVLTFDRSLVLHFNGEDIRMVHLPHGHTDGDTVIFFQKGKVASLGDLYFSGMFPIFHLEHDGDLDGYIRNLRTILAQIDDGWKIVPGHGPLSNKTDLVRYVQMITDSVATVRQGLRSGKGLEQIQKDGLAPKWEPFSHGYVNTDRWIAMIYAALKK